MLIIWCEQFQLQLISWLQREACGNFSVNPLTEYWQEHQMWLPLCACNRAVLENPPILFVWELAESDPTAC